MACAQVWSTFLHPFLSNGAQNSSSFDLNCWELNLQSVAPTLEQIRSFNREKRLQMRLSELVEVKQTPGVANEQINVITL